MREWCRSCDAPAEVVETFVDDTGDRERVFRVFSVTQLDCGHAITYEIDPRSVS